MVRLDVVSMDDTGSDDLAYILAAGRSLWIQAIVSQLTHFVAAFGTGEIRLHAGGLSAGEYRFASELRAVVDHGRVR